MADEIDYTDKYNTPIPAKQLSAFNTWVANQRKAGRDPLRDKFNYDVQGDWLAGAIKDQRGHGSDTFKKPNHPTFSDESKYHGVNGNLGGHWGSDNTYTPSETNLQFHSLPELQQYFKKIEPDIKLLPLESVWDKAARTIMDTQAQSRFTRTPIDIRNVNPKAEEKAATGEYISDVGKYYVSLYGKQPTYQDLQKTIHHEDIHALLIKAGILKPDLLQPQPGTPIPDVRMRAFESLGMGNRAGNPIVEAPAYVGAFSHTEMPGFTPQDRQAWLDQFKNSIPNKVADIYKRIINSYQASQLPLPVEAPSLVGYPSLVNSGQ